MPVFELHANRIIAHLLLQMAFFFYSILGDLFMVLNTGRFIHGIAYRQSSLTAYPGTKTTFLSFISAGIYLCIDRWFGTLFTHTHQRNHTVYILPSLDFLLFNISSLWLLCLLHSSLLLSHYPFYKYLIFYPFSSW